MTEAEMRPVIVIGVDGSEPSKDAVRWAAKQAELTGAELHAVTAWRFPPTYGYPVDYSDVDFAALARKTLEEVVAETLGQTPQVPVTARVIEGHPAAVLIDASRSADLLVVGSRGRGAFTGMLLGSVSQQCVLHATCPVLVVRQFHRVTIDILLSHSHAPHSAGNMVSDSDATAASASSRHHVRNNPPHQLRIV